MSLVEGHRGFSGLFRNTPQEADISVSTKTLPTTEETTSAYEQFVNATWRAIELWVVDFVWGKQEKIYLPSHSSPASPVLPKVPTKSLDKNTRVVYPGTGQIVIPVSPDEQLRGFPDLTSYLASGKQ